MISNVEPKYLVPKNTIQLQTRRWLRAPTAGMFIQKIANGSEVKKDQELGMVTDTYTKRIKFIKAPFDGYVLCINHQAVVNQGDALFHVGKT